MMECRRARSYLVCSVITVAVATTACGTRRPPRLPGATPPASSAAALPEPGALGSAVVDSALALQGAPYRNGGAAPPGFDCSGFVQYVFAEHGVVLPRSAREQFDATVAVPPDEVQPGDLVFFETVDRGPSHVGIVVRDGLFVHAPSGNGVVRVERLTAEYWSKRYLGARRVKQ